MDASIQKSLESVARKIESIRVDVNNRQKAMSKSVLGALESPGGTPVITGRLRANWKVGLGEVNSSSDWENYDKSSLRTYNEGAAIIDMAVLGQDVVISNSIPYAARIDFVEGIAHPQNPLGMRLPVMEKIAARSGSFANAFSDNVSATVSGKAGPR